MVDSDAVFERVWPARVGRDVAADRASPWARWIGSKVKAPPALIILATGVFLLGGDFCAPFPAPGRVDHG